MEIDKVIKRLNFLYHKRIDEGLTKEELDEQTRLRQEYLEMVRRNFRSQLDRIKIVDATDTREGTCRNHEHQGCDCGKH